MGVLNHRYGVDSATFETGSTLDSCSAEDDERVAALVRLSDAATSRLAVVGEPLTEPERPGTGGNRSVEPFRLSARNGLCYPPASAGDRVTVSTRREERNRHHEGDQPSVETCASIR